MTNSHDSLKALENMTAVFNDLQVLKSTINGHEEELYILDSNIQTFLKAMKNKFYRMTITLYNHLSSIKMLMKALTAYTKVLTKYMGFCDTYSRAFQYFFYASDAF